MPGHDPSPPLPAVTVTFLQRRMPKPARSLILAFHRWMVCEDIELAALTPSHVQRFLLQPRRRPIRPSTLKVYRPLLLPYLRWLREKDHLSFDLVCLRRRRPLELPAIAEQFLRSLAPTRKKATCANIAVTLRKLHSWLLENALALESLRRDDLVRWFEHLHQRNLRAETRLHILVGARTYLRWLAECHLLLCDPDDLIRRSDFPKLPRYLPRPLPQALDLELQRRLSQSRDVAQAGLLLMRWTGLRVGELRSLECDCVRNDLTGNAFLKVPLGKLNTERLVPIDDATQDLISRLQAQSHIPRPHLLQTHYGRVPYRRIWVALKSITHDLKDSIPITTHRLRHTYASSLLSAGMSLVGLMRLLGHSDYRMTLRYAAITEQSVGKEYREALANLQARYQLPPAGPANVVADPSKLLQDVSRWLRGQAFHDPARIRRILKRLERLRAEIHMLDFPEQ